MKMQCAGIMPIKIENDKVYVFLCHPYGRMKTYGIAKGLKVEVESIEEAAHREFEEETGISNIEEIAKCIGSTICSNKEKDVTCFYYLLNRSEDIDPSSCYSNLFVDQHGNVHPENDKYKWFEINEAERNIFIYQRSLIKDLIDKLKG